MSSLPLISHHLFVKAAGGNTQSTPRQPREDRPSISLKGIATALPLELLEAVQPMPSGAARQMRASMGTSET